jgi:hypothetical protein
MTDKPTHKQCRQCGEWFTLKPYARPTQKFCTVSCAAIYRTSQPKWRKAQSAKVKARTDPEVMRERSRAMWRNPETRARLAASNKKRANTKEHLAWMAEHNKRLWSDPKFRKAAAARSSEALKQLWTDPAFREENITRMVEENKRRWANPDYKERVSRSIRRAKLAPLELKRQSKASKELAARPETKARTSAIMKARWKDPEQAARMIKRASETAHKRWRDDPDYRAKKLAVLKRNARSPEARARMAEMSKRLRTDPEHIARRKAWWEAEGRAKQIERNKKLWADPAWKARVAAKISAAKRGVST